MGKIRDIAKVSFATVGSRVLGLVRDAATGAYIGVSAVSSAYIFAFTLPNLFRRLLGEGAMSSALVPIFTQSLKEGGQENAFAFLNKVITRAGLLLLAITIFGMAAAACAAPFLSGTERFYLSAQYSVVLAPYVLLICLAAVFSSALNVLGSFGAPSVGPILLNISIICGLLVGVRVFGADNAVALGYSMCFAWIAGGAMQLAVPMYWLFRKGWRFRFDLKPCPEMGELYALFIPALIGAAVIQVNIFVSKILAQFLNDSAITTLYYSSRILEFPLGVFAVAIATVYFPRLALKRSAGDEEGYKREYSNGFVISMCISVPAMVGLIILGREILTLLFEWGMFKSSDISLTLPVLLVSLAGLPFFTLATFATRGFHSAKDTKTPVKISYYSIGANLLLSAILMFPFGAPGLAAANVIAAVLQAVMLNFSLKKKFGSFGHGAEIVKIVAASAAMGVLVLLGKEFASLLVEGKSLALVSCAAIIPAGVAFYFAALKFLKFKQLDEIQNILLKRRRQ